MSQARSTSIEAIEQDRLRKRKLSEVASQDSALFRLLGSSLAPYKKWLAISMVLMLTCSGRMVVMNSMVWAMLSAVIGCTPL